MSVLHLTFIFLFIIIIIIIIIIVIIITVVVVVVVTQTLMTVLDSHARMVEIVQIRLMISFVIVFPDTQAKTVPSVRKIIFIIDFLNPPRHFSPLVFLMFL